MILKKDEIPKVLDKVKAAFPNLKDWEYNNRENDMYFGFSVWGEYVLSESKNDLDSTHFYITFSVYDALWSGTLSVGKPAYLWTSADFGDAYLVHIKDCDTLEKAISVLKKKTAGLFRAFSID